MIGSKSLSISPIWVLLPPHLLHLLLLLLYVLSGAASIHPPNHHCHHHQHRLHHHGPLPPTVIAALCFVWNCLSLHIHIHQLHPPKQPHTRTHLDHHIPSTSTINIIIIVIITNFYLHIHQLNQPKHLKIVWQRFHPNALQCSAPFEVSLKVVVLGRILPAAVVKVMSRYIPPDIEQEANQYKFSAISLILECECVGFHSKENTKHVATDLQTFHVLLLFKFNQF